MALILAVDDEPSITKLVAVTLEAKGHEVLIANSGIEAIAAAKVKKPDLILLDIMMPGMDGNEVRKRLLKDQDTKDIPIVHLSAVGDFQQQLTALDGGTIDYITKPFAPKELQERVADLVDPAKRAEIKKEHDRKTGKTRTIVEIMRRHEDK